MAGIGCCSPLRLLREKSVVLGAVVIDIFLPLHNDMELEGGFDKVPLFVSTLGQMDFQINFHHKAWVYAEKAER